MSFESLVTQRIGIPYFAAGGLYSAEADRRRFLYLDYNQTSYVGVIGVGLVDGWAVTSAGGLNVVVGYGTAIISEAFSESPFVVKNREDILPSDYVIDTDYYIQLSPNGEPVPLDYDPEFYPPPPPPVDVTAHYDKVLYQPTVALNNNADNYVYIYRNLAYVQEVPYYVPNNSSPVMEERSTFNPLHTAVAFGVTASLSYAQSSGRALIAKVTTRAGNVVSIDTSKVTTIKNLQASILAFGQKMVNEHKHGGNSAFDPEAIHLATDRRRTVLSSSNNQSIVYQILYYIPTSVTDGHKHYFFVDSSGNGFAVVLIGSSAEAHYHTISSYVVQDAVFTDGSSHTHTITLTTEDPDAWDSVEDYVIYINGNVYSGTNSLVNPETKTITFTDDVTVLKRKFYVEKNGYTFTSEDSTVYRFMLRMALDFYSKNNDAISAGTVSPIILPDPSTPVTDLSNQCSVAEQFLKEAGDIFTFVGSVAPDPVQIKLLEPGHVDEIQVEITANSEVTGKLRESSILYIPAEKFVTGVFEIGRIPILSHSFRYLEECNFTSERMYSYDGYTFQVASSYPWGNIKNVYATYVDDSGNILIGTSDGVYSYPTDGAYLFIINGEKIVTPYGNLYDMFSSAAEKYAALTGKTFIYNEQLYGQQIADAEPRLSANGSMVEMRGYYNTSKTASYFDIVYICYVDGYKLPNFGYTAYKSQSEMIQGEEVEIPRTVNSTGLLKVRNDFNRSTVKRFFTEKSLDDQYGGVSRAYYALASDYIARSTNIDQAWALGYQSGLTGYMIDFFRMYNSYYVTYGSNGIYVCTNYTSAEYKKMLTPDFYTEISAASFGYSNNILIAYQGLLYFTSNFGKTWNSTNSVNTNYVSIFFDPTEDVTGLTCGHYHDISIDTYGTGYTEGIYDQDGNPIIGDLHYHTISSGVIGEADGHTHSAIRTFYALDDIGRIYVSSDYATWSLYTSISSDVGEYGLVFAAFGKLFVVVSGGLIRTSDGVTWEVETAFEERVLSANWSETNQVMYLGGQNELYSYDGNDFSTVLSLDGVVKPSVYVDGSKRLFGYYINNLKRKVDFYGIDLSESGVDVIYEFDKCYPKYGGWSSKSGYDLYINERLVKSAKVYYGTSGDAYLSVTDSSNKADVNNSGYVDFSVSSITTSKLSFGAYYVEVKSAADFPESGYIRLLSTSGSLVLEYTGKQEDRLYLKYRSQYESAAGSSVKLLSTVGDGDDVLITIAESKFPGLIDHYTVEDKLSLQNIGLPKSFSDVYLSNLMHITVAIKYAISSVGSDYMNYFLSMFDYDDIPGSEYNINRFIDVTNSNLYSQLRYSSTFYPLICSKIYKTIFGFGDFDNVLFVATDLGLYSMKINSGYDANWFEIDVDGSSSVYDFIQMKSDLLVAVTDKGMYKSSDGNSWTQYDSLVVGGDVLKVSARWTNIEDYSGGSYWWQNWSGVENENENLTNSFIVSGFGFCSVTNDYGTTWNKSYITVPYNFSSFTMSNVVLLHNGSVMSSFVPSAVNASSLIVSTDMGTNWNSKYTFFGYSGNITGYTVTKYGNVSLKIQYTASAPPFELLRGYKLYFNNKKYDIIDNYYDEVVIFESEIVSSLPKTADSNGSYGTITINPITPNAICELPQGNLLVGTDNGIFTDIITLSDSGANIGIVKDIGVKATVNSLNINGSVISNIFSNSERVMVSVLLDRVVSSNELKGQFLRAFGYTDREILSNDRTGVDGLTNIFLKYEDPDIQASTPFTILRVLLQGGKNVETNRIYVNFDSYTTPGSLAGGFMYIEPLEADTTPVFSEVVQFSISRNGYDYIDFTVGNLPDGTSVADIMQTEVVVLCTLSNGLIPVYIDIASKPSPGSFKGRVVEVQNVSSNLEKVDFVVQDNEENVIYLPRQINAQSTDQNGNKTTKNFSTYNCIFSNMSAVFIDSMFYSDKTFNYRKSSVQNDHLHDISIYGKTASGQISSLGESTAAYVDLYVTGVTPLLDPPFAGNPTLLSGQRMVVYDSDSYSSTFALEILETYSNRIRVKNSGDIFNFSGTDDRKISAGHSLFVDTSYYGTTSAPVFTDNFVISKMYLTGDLFLHGTDVTVNSTLGLFVGGNVNLRDRGGKKFTTSISSIISSTVFRVADQVPFDYLQQNNSYCEILYTKVGVVEGLLTADSSIDTYLVQISDTTGISAGDFVRLYDNRGLLFVSTVDNVVDSTTFTVVDKISADYTVLNSSYCNVTRSNYSDSHTHTIKSGEFSVDSNFNWNVVGYSYYHSHIVSPLIKEVNDIKVLHGKAYVVGSGSEMYTSINSGLTWDREVDLADVNTLAYPPGVVQSIATNGRDILFGTDSGGLVYFTSNIPAGIVPLEKPIA